MATVLLALVQGLAALCFLFAERYIERERLFAPETPPDLLERGHVRNVVLMVIFGVSIPLAFVVNGWAYIAGSLIPAAMWLGMVVQQRRTHRAEVSRS